MGVVADAMLAGGGSVTGVIPDGLAVREVAHRGLREMRVVPSMHARKALMAELSDGFVALPGGYGTFEELLEIVTWAQLGIHGKPMGILDVDGYFEPLIALFDRAVREGFVSPENRGLVLVEDTPEKLLDRMEAHRPAPRRAWVTPEEA
jgi:uncharacterized protein (TIGR00730 family)